MKGNIQLLMDLGTLPFHVGFQDLPTNVDLPDTLPFCAGVHLDQGLLIQMPNADVSQHLESAYAKGSFIGTAMSEHGIGRNYAEDFLGFILRNVELSQRRRWRLLEIGCGTGYLLYRLKQLGFETLGIEPGIKAQQYANEYGLRIIQDKFPGNFIPSQGSFEIIVHYGVLEHIEDPVAFLKAQAEFLSGSGRIFLSVPNCEEYIVGGDISMFVHEHWNYFTPHSLKTVIEAAGFRILKFENAGYGGSMYAITGPSDPTHRAFSGLKGFSAFADLVQRSVNAFKAFLGMCRKRRRSVGIFCPGRVLNLLHVTQTRNQLRFFDDDELLHGKFYPPFDIPVESRESLLKRPVDELVIMSSSFGKKLQSELFEEGGLQNTNIRLFAEIVETLW